MPIVVCVRGRCCGRRTGGTAAFQTADARIQIDVLILAATLHFIQLVAQLLDLTLQRLHLRLQCIDLVDQIDIRLGTAVSLCVLLKLGHALGEAEPLRLYRRAESNGGQQGRRANGSNRVC